MKKALTVLALVGGAAALAAYKLNKDAKQKNVTDGTDEEVEKHIITFEETEEELEEECGPVFETTSYPNLNEEDIKSVNEICETVFEGIDFENVGDEERPIQHTLHFENKILMEKFKSIVIEEGFVVTNGENENDLVVLHISKVDVDLILSKVFYLTNLAKECNGTFVKWVLK